MAESLPQSSSSKPEQSEESTSELLFIDFSRTLDRVVVGAGYGLTIYKTRNTEVPHVYNELSRRTQIADTSFMDDIILIECCPLVHKFALVMGKAPRTLCFYDAARTRTTGTQIISVGLEDEIHVFSIYPNNFEKLDDIFRIVVLPVPYNLASIMDMVGEERPHLVYPDSDSYGIVAVHDINSRSYPKRTIAAHSRRLAVLRLNDIATLVATASIIGTVIRVYDVRRRECLFMFRRGLARSVAIHSMLFSSDSRFLCLTSDTETIHVFKLEGTIPKVLRLEQELIMKAKERETAVEPGWYDYLVGSTTRTAAEYFSPIRDFASAILPEKTDRNLAGVKMINNNLHILAANSNGKFFAFSINRDGGIAKLVNSGKLLPMVYS
ncbi:hypothetical protein DINM_003886 [Dirofilaria immitis]|nr:hypothetical protein [Dirofilaria immitis]